MSATKINLKGITELDITGITSPSVAHGVVSFTIAGGSWNAIGNATGALTLANADYTSTFNQTSAVAWTWANTTVATVSTTNASPLLELAANYWATGAVSALDTWSIGSSLAAGLNGASTLTINHVGSTGAAVVSFKTFVGTNTSGLITTVGSTNFGLYNQGSYIYGYFGPVYCNKNTPFAVTSCSIILYPFSPVQIQQVAGCTVGWTGSATNALDGLDTGISRLGAASLAIGNGTAGDFTGTVSSEFVRILGAGNAVTFVETSPLSIGINASGTGLLIQNTATDYMDFVSGGVVKGIRGIGTTPMIFGVNNASLTIYSSGTIYHGAGGGITVGTNTATLQAKIYGFAADSTSASATDTGISRLGAASLAIGNGTAGDKTGNLSFNRVNLAGADYAGQATITAAATTKAVTFAANYTGTAQPVIVITPTSDPLALGVPVGYWVTYSGGAGAWTGFTVNIQTALAGDVTFNYCVLGKA